MGAETKTFPVRRSNRLGAQACQAAQTDDVWAVMNKTDLWVFAASADAPACKAKDINFMLSIEEPARFPTDVTPYDRVLDIVVKVGKRTVATGRYTVHHRWDPYASYRIYDSDFDNYVNTCINGSYEIRAEGGRLRGR